ncbi:hypothetical protein AAG906_038919 [Vitis piasezkii]
MEELPAFSSRLYHITIKHIDSYVVVNQKFNDPKVFVLWHDRLSHPRSSRMHQIIEHSHGHPLKNQKIILPNEYSCAACSQGKLISHVCFLFTRNVAFARLLTIRLDNAGEFTSQTFIDHCMSVEINIEHLVAHTYTQNGLAESFIKCLQLIARPLLMKTKLPTSAWGHAIMHVAALVRIRPTTYHEYSSSQLKLRKQPNIYHLRIFGCAVYVPIAPTQRTKMGPQQRLGNYVGFDFSSIIRYLEPLTDDVFIAALQIVILMRVISQVQRIIHLQNLANQLPNAFIDTKKIVVPVGQLTNESKIRLKCGRLVGSKDVTPRKRRTQEKLGTLEKAIKMINQKPLKRHILNKKSLKRNILNKKPLKRHRYRSENNEIIRYKTRLVAQGFLQRPSIDYEEAYSPIMDAITFHFLISLVVLEGLDMRFKLLEANSTKHRSMYSIKLQRSLYGLKQSRRMWYNCLSKYLLKEGYANNPICPCIFIKKSETRFAIIVVFIDDLNLVGTPEELTRTTNYLKKNILMKDLGKTKFCLGCRSNIF